ncbi:hypothetical protein C8J48_0380 [Desmospora activa DSM 45169]|uniref:Uncharacterized protein n=1 Tax=Desmospora activa DSM 45169 TaxID=1121389 RepID=A0A2T4Z7F1_9BACL|nr:hypothetical protein C8J48_0380 [Desmospora activa DSM 45169]
MTKAGEGVSSSPAFAVVSPQLFRPSDLLPTFRYTVNKNDPYISSPKDLREICGYNPTSSTIREPFDKHIPL